MISPHNTHKIQSEHLERQALIYIRQSTLAQAVATQVYITLTHLSIVFTINHHYVYNIK